MIFRDDEQDRGVELAKHHVEHTLGHWGRKYKDIAAISKHGVDMLIACHARKNRVRCKPTLIMLVMHAPIQFAAFAGN